MKVFFYGLFMDESLLASKGVTPRNAKVGFVDGFMLYIGERATLLPTEGARAYGVLMTIASDDVKELYEEDSVVDYLPESVTVECMDGRRFEATCYNLPGSEVKGVNDAYADKLWHVAQTLRLPEHYLDEIKRAGM